MLISIGTFLLNPVLSQAKEEKYNMSYIYFGDNSTYSSYVESTKGSLDEISPNYYNLTDEGNLESTTAIDESFVEEMHAQGVKVMPFLSNHWDRAKGINALSNREALAQQLTDSIMELNVDGIQVDLENLTEVQKDAYTDFVRLLRAKLPENKTIAVAVAPNPFWTEKGWQGSYDYRNLAEYADYLLIMAYDESYTGSDPGPVASGNFVEKSIQYALERVPKDKIVLGIPFYGRYWDNDQNYGGYAVSSNKIEKIVQEYNGVVEFDPVTKSAKATVTIKKGDPKPTVAWNRTLDSGTYTIWYENTQSIEYKLSLVQKYDLKGAGSWSLGQEPDHLWDYYTSWLNGNYFADILGHWAEADILSIYDLGWMLGQSTQTFAPDASLTRAEATVTLIRALGLDERAGEEKEFTDILGHWAAEEIKVASRYGIVEGRGDGIFDPNAFITRQEMAVMLDRIFNQGADEIEGEETPNPFEDVTQPDNSWSYDAILRLNEEEIFKGDENGNFLPLKNTTRAEMAALMDRLTPRLLEEEIAVVWK